MEKDVYRYLMQMVNYSQIRRDGKMLKWKESGTKRVRFYQAHGGHESVTNQAHNLTTGDKSGTKKKGHKSGTDNNLEEEEKRSES